MAACTGIPYDIRFQMVKNLKGISKSKEQTKRDQEASNYSPLEDPKMCRLTLQLLNVLSNVLG